MLNVSWSVLNAALLLGCCYLFGRAALLLRRHLGMMAASFFVSGVLLISCGKSEKAASTTAPANLLASVPPQAPCANSSAVQRIALGGTNHLFLLAEYYTENGLITKPRGLYATVSGVTLGHAWEPARGLLRKRGDRLFYTAAIDHHWSLLGMRVFTQSGEIFEGLMPLSRQSSGQ